METQYNSFWNKSFLFMIVYNIVSSTTYNMITPILVKFLTGNAIPLAMAGTISGLISITALVVRPFSGYLTDSMNKKRLLIFATALMGTASIGLALSHNIPLTMLFRILQGVGFALNGTCSISMAVNYMPAGRIGEGIGYFGISQIITSSLGPTLGLELGARIGYGNTIILAGISVLFACVLMLLFRYNNEAAEEKMRLLEVIKSVKLDNLISKELFALTLFVAAFSLSNSLVSNYLALHCDSRSISGYAAYFTVCSATLLLTRPLAGRLTDKKGLAYVLIPSYIFAGTALILIASAKSLLPILAAAVFKALGQGTGQPAIQAECLRRLGPEKRGLATSTYYIGADVANGIAPMVGGFVASSFSYGIMFYFAAAMIGFALLGFLVYAQKEKQRG